MKLKNTSFCTRAGAVWRQLAILAVFPWLAKYRVFGEERLSNALLSFQKSSEETKADTKDFAEQLQYRIGAVEGVIADTVFFAEAESDDLRASI